MKDVSPVDQDISIKLNETIKSNIDIYLERERGLASLEAERRQLKAEMQLEVERRELIELKAKNAEMMKILEEKSETMVKLEKAKADAESLAIVTQAEIDAEVKRVQMMSNALGSSTGQAYIDLIRSQQIRDVDKMLVVPSDSKIEFNLNNK